MKVSINVFLRWVSYGMLQLIQYSNPITDFVIKYNHNSFNCQIWILPSNTWPWTSCLGQMSQCLPMICKVNERSRGQTGVSCVGDKLIIVTWTGNVVTLCVGCLKCDIPGLMAVSSQSENCILATCDTHPLETQLSVKLTLSPSLWFANRQQSVDCWFSSLHPAR